MTRETKVGLLVGLAFIIVIGILLSDYNRLETQPAALKVVGDSLATGAATPNPHNGSTENLVVPPPTPATPLHPVPTREEVRQETKIVVGPGSGPSPARSPDSGIRPSQPNGPVARNEGSGGAANGNSNLIDPAPRHINDDQNASPKDPAVEPPTVNHNRQYVAVAGDTLSKLAGRFLGVNTKANREAIASVNPSLKQNPNNIIVGRTYIIPNAKSGPADAITPPVADRTPPAPAATPTPSNADATAVAWYTVKDNDSLWKIAADQLGDGTAWTSIRDANKDVLKGGESVRKNMRLRIPPKSVASTN